MNPDVPNVPATRTTRHDKPKPRQLTDLIPLILDSVPSENTQRAYKRVIEEFLSWIANTSDGTPPTFDRALAQQYMRHLGKEEKSPSTINQALTVLRKLANEAVDHRLLDPNVARTIERIKPIKRLGRRTGQWLEKPQAQKLISAPDLQTNKGLRDRVLIGLLLECGLRRDEAALLDVKQFQVREGRAILADVKGKGQRVRTVPVPSLCATRIKQWIRTAGIGTSGPLLRPVDKSDKVTNRQLTAPALYKQILEYATELNLKCAPHDLRRTFAKLAYARDPNLIAQIKEALGHSSIRTTEIYLGIRLDLKDAACDALDLDDGKE